MAITVDVISDVICPWCYVGKRRLEKAIASLAEARAVRVHWHPFQLNPQMPKEGMDRQEYRIAKFGSWERSVALDDQLTAVARTEGLSFHLDAISRRPNTLDAHRLICLADREGVQDAVVEALFRSYFMDGKDIGNAATLLEVVSGAGLDRGRAEVLLNGDDGTAAVWEADTRARMKGVQGVPFFTIADSITVSGAREPSVFHAALEQVEDEAELMGRRQPVASRGRTECVEGTTA